MRSCVRVMHHANTSYGVYTTCEHILKFAGQNIGGCIVCVRVCAGW